MRHFYFHMPFIITERVPNEEAPGTTIVVDVGRRHLDVQVHAPDIETAAKLVQEKVSAAFDDKDLNLEYTGPYIGPV